MRGTRLTSFLLPSISCDPCAESPTPAYIQTPDSVICGDRGTVAEDKRCQNARSIRYPYSSLFFSLLARFHRAICVPCILSKLAIFVFLETTILFPNTLGFSRQSTFVFTTSGMSDHHNPLSVVMPCHFSSQHDFPTEVIAQRFQAWRYIVKDLVTYLKQYSSVQEEILRQQARLQQAVGASARNPASPASNSRPSHKGSDKEIEDELLAINHYFLPIGNGSIQDFPTVLTKFHQQNIANGTKTLKELNVVIIPKLEELRKDLMVKIKEIKNLLNDFKNTLAKEMTETKALMGVFSHATDVANRLENLGNSTEALHHEGSDVDSSKNDPYLVKIRLDRQLKRQLSEENYLYEAFKNLQTSSEKLESIVVLEIQTYFRMFLNLVETEHSSVANLLVPNLSNGFLAKEPTFEWDSFIQRNLPQLSSISNTMTSGKFIDLSFPARKMADLVIPNFESLVNVAVREGRLERRSKFLKSYSSGWYVLTCSYIHEFKSSDRRKDQTPVMSLSLDSCLVSEHSKDDGKLSGAYKFVLYSKLQNGLIHRGHNWVFRCSTYQGMIEWYNDIKALTSLASPASRAKAMSKKLQATVAEKRVSRSSSFLTAASGVRSPVGRTLTNATGGSKQDVNLSPKVTNISVGSRAVSQNISMASTGQNQRLSSTFSHKNYPHSPKLSNLINSDGTIVTPIETHNQGDTTLTSNDTHRDLEAASTKQNTSQPLPLPVQNGGFPGPQATPQQFIPQNYQYYFNQMNQQPQQFYDPVLQQFFTINAIPALQVVPDQQLQPPLQHLQQVPGQSQPLPQYFPSSPLPQPGQHFASSPNVQAFVPTSPQVNQGQFVPAQESGKLAQYIPHFPQQFNEGDGSQLPYPVQLGSVPSTRQNSTTSNQENGSVQVPVQDEGGTKSVDDQMSKLTITDEN